MRALTLLVTAAAAFVLPVPTATATPAATPAAFDRDPFPFPCFFAPSPGSGWVPVASGFSACAPCETAGEAGVSKGDWAAYHCAFVPIGLDGSYWLFVPEAAQLTTTAPDPYIDALAPANEVPVTDPANLTGPPDDRFATVSGRFARFLVLDLGAGEEGIGDLEVRFHQSPGTLPQTMDVHFLDGNGQDLGQGQLAMIGTGTRTTTVTNPSVRPYRYLKILTGLQTARFDSMRAEAVAS
jgi:hypothetical protein